MKKKAIVIHSGGMDSSLCLYQAILDHGRENILSLSFSYGQRHEGELEIARQICERWGVDHQVLDIHCLEKITENSLTRHQMEIGYERGEPNSLVVGRNGLMARLAAIHIDALGGDQIYMGIIEVEEANSGYRDCSRRYMDLLEKILQIDLSNPKFQIKTPIVKMTKYETMELGQSWGVLTYLLENTITCYEGFPKEGCQRCPACKLRNEGILEFKKRHPHFILSFLHKLKKPEN